MSELDEEIERVKAQMEATETSATGWVKTHIAWIIGLGCALFGFILGTLTK